MDLFFEEKSVQQNETSAPLAERMRPREIDHCVGQNHVAGSNKIIRQIIENGLHASIILWGPPGSGKTTMAGIIADKYKGFAYSISAVTSNLAELRKIIASASKQKRLSGQSSILFIDEIHRFNKAQQDALLHPVEDGSLILIGATTENPSFEVNAPLLSRCRVINLVPLDENDLRMLVKRALDKDVQLGAWNTQIDDEAENALIQLCGGDARVLLNGLELSAQMADSENNRRIITAEIVKEAMQRQFLVYDKKGDSHYNMISAMIKALRGSDPDGAVYWLARMLDGGEDPLFIARRLIILASEDIGNADPFALVLANSAFEGTHKIGMPEARIILAQAVTYLAAAPKSNAAYEAISEALADAGKTAHLPVPLSIRNAPTRLMKEMGYGKGYQYAHAFKDGFIEQTYLPEELKDRIYYEPKPVGREKGILERLTELWPKRRFKHK